MKLKDFLAKYHIELAPEIEKVCRDGIVEMQKSKDPAHSDIHVFDLISILDLFLEKNGSLNCSDIDFNILLPAMCWHDVWKSRRKQTKNIIKFKLEQLWDGIGSARIFRKYSSTSGLSRTTITSIALAVKCHGGFYRSRLTETHPIEVKLLCDLDNLGFWSMKRLKHAESQYLNPDGTFKNPKYIPVAEWILRKLANTRNVFFFTWSEEEFDRRKGAVLKRGYDIIEMNRGERIVWG